MRLIHYSHSYITEVRDVMQCFGDGSRGDKPTGLWVSVEGPADWKAWCESEGFHVNRLRCPTEVVLQPEANLLHLRDADDLRTFHRKYRAGRSSACPRWEADFRIRWDRVANSYDGIVIAPYVWEMRLDRETPWYYGWDCASGCIWRSRAISELRPLPETVSVEAA